MASFIEFPIFTGVSGDLRPWISWLEAFFVREKFKKLEKMNLAQSLLEGEAESWFYSIQKTLIFYDWRELKDKLLLRFGDVADSDRIRLIADLDRFLLKQRADAKLRRLSRTAITPQESISSPATIHETVPVAKFPNQHVDEISGEKKDESHEATMVTVLDSLEEESITQNQVPVSKLEHSLPIPKKSLNVCENSQAVVSCEHQRSIQKTIGLDVVNSDVERIQCVMSISKNVSAHQVLDKMCQLTRLKPKNKRKLSLSLKTWMFKFKNKMLQRNKSTNRIHAELTFDAVNVSNSRSNKSSDPSSFDYSKYGTVITNDMGEREKVHKLLNQEEIFKDGDVIMFGTGSANGNGDDVESTNGANGANGGGDIDVLPPPPPILPPNVEPLHVKTEPVEKKNLRVPVVSKILDNVHEPYHSDLDGKEFAYGGEKTLFTYGVLPDNKLDFAVVLEEVSAARPNGNASPNGNENELIHDNLKSYMWHKWKSKHLRPVFDLHNNPSYAWDIVNKPVTECKTTDAVFQPMLERTVSHDCFLGSLWERKIVSWLGVVCVLGECLFVGCSSAEQVFHGLFLRQQNSSSIWHRWRRKGEWKEEKTRVKQRTDTHEYMSVHESTTAPVFAFSHLSARALQRVQSSVPPELLALALWIPEAILEGRFAEVGRHALLIQWQDFVQLYPFSKLEDKLVFGEGSIDTIQGCDDVAKC